MNMVCITAKIATRRTGLTHLRNKHPNLDAPRAARTGSESADARLKTPGPLFSCPVGLCGCCTYIRFQADGNYSRLEVYRHESANSIEHGQCSPLRDERLHEQVHRNTLGITP